MVMVGVRPPPDLLPRSAEILPESQARFECPDGDYGPNQEPAAIPTAPRQLAHEKEDEDIPADEQEVLESPGWRNTQGSEAQLRSDRIQGVHRRRPLR